MENKNLKLRKVVATQIKPIEPGEYKKSIHFNYDSLPVAKHWKVGGKYLIVLHVEQTSMGKDGADFDIHKVGEYQKGGGNGQ